MPDRQHCGTVFIKYNTGTDPDTALAEKFGVKSLTVNLFCLRMLKKFKKCEKIKK
jgi:hypothetical protein